ncbi:MAG TPA: hypothetical protein PKH40_12700, partial [Treponemataceae bacterium]|nr:hypothetical protein [Treponemataceae bacterium]
DDRLLNWLCRTEVPCGKKQEYLMNATHCHKGSGAKRSSLAAAAASIIAFAAFAGCEQPSDKDSANQEQSLPAGLEQEEAVPATAENILGT